MKSPGAQDTYLSRFIRGALQQAPATLFAAVFSLAVAALYTRMFTPEEYGVYSFVIAITGPVIVILTEWLAQSIGRFYNEYMRRGRLNDIWQLVTVFSTMLVTLTALGTLAGLGWAALTHRSLDLLLCGSAVAVVLLQGMSAVLLPVFLADFRANIYRRLTLGTTVTGTAVSLLLIALFGKHVAYLLTGQAIALLIFLTLTVRFSGWTFRWAHLRALTRTRHTAARYTRYGLPMMAWFLSASLLDVSDRYAIQSFRGAHEMGLYAVNYGLISGLAMLINVPVSLTLGPLLYEQWSKRDTVAVTATVKQMTTVYAAFALFFVGLIVVVERDLVNLLLGEEFRPGYVILVPVLIGRLLWGLSIIGQKSLELRERTNLMAWNAAAAAFCNVLLNLLLVPRYGYIAAAYTTLASYGLYVLLIARQTRTQIRWSIHPTPVVHALIASGVAAALTTLVLRWVGNTPLTGLLLGTAIFTVIFAALYGPTLPPVRASLYRLVRPSHRRSSPDVP